ncbi:RHS repeat-associated core domain-containing protein [Pseudomonas putida]|uniref:RHS repeat-associated core domain-containing protein n=1 Tax=Pseudomonas putida TaxID=303 RepID=A0A6I6Y2G6_PSEPU|nr:RHS repeat-associated core domain-containing protein [Pseudomonas putida]QHG65807.1 RHS repeat-associated core domain-containing protein [Pseudomonas putida]
MALDDGKKLHTGTPDMTVLACSSKIVLALCMRRSPHDVLTGTPAQLLRTRTESEPLTRTIRTFGPRNLKVTPELPLLPDSVMVASLGGKVLFFDTADGDASLGLFDSAGRPLWTRNAQGTDSRCMYEARENGGRLVAVIEQPAAGQPRVRQKLAYGDVLDGQRQRNLVGVVTVEHDNAGELKTQAVALTGKVMLTGRRLLHAQAELPDWAGESANDLDDDVLTVAAGFNSVGALLIQTNAADVMTAYKYDISGAPCLTSLGKEFVEAMEFRTLQRRAEGALLLQEMSNGVVERFDYEPKTQRLARHLVFRPASHRSGGLVISDLNYRYDPVGNVISVVDQNVGPYVHRNRISDGQRLYTYDTLYRLVDATGRERSPVNHFSQESIAFSGGSVWRNYTEHYTYDDGGNLTHLKHNGGAGDRTRTLVVSERSNRAMVDGHALTPDNGFLSGGLQMQLEDGRALHWMADGQLGSVSLLRRLSASDDTERYCYASRGERVRKVTTLKTAGGVQTTTTTYAGGCEIRQRATEGRGVTQQSVLITEVAGGRLLEDRQEGKQYLRFAITDHLRSCMGETDQEGKLTAREEFTPYGTTAGLDEGVIESSGLLQRTYRHAGKELDATGLYYYGWRYYQPGLGRWLSADPGGMVDGSNLYTMCGDNPISFVDPDGRMKEDATSLPLVGNFPSFKAARRSSQTDVRKNQFAQVEAEKIGESVIGEGLADIGKRDPVFAKSLSRAHAAAKLGISFAKGVMERMNVGQGSDKELAVVSGYFFDKNRATLTPENIDKIHDDLSLLSHEIMAFSTDNLIGVSSRASSNVAAWVVEGDESKRIFVRDNYKASPRLLTWNIIHELTHFKLDSLDMWYVMSPFQKLPGHEGEGSFRKILNADIVNQRDMNLKTKGGYVFLGADAAEFEVGKFSDVSEADYVVDQMMKNADSIAMLIYVVNYHLNGPLKAQANRKSDLSRNSAGNLPVRRYSI